MSPGAGYPSFTPLFLPGRGTTTPLYLELLNVTAGAPESLRVLRRAAAVSGASLDAELVALLRESHWRAHLVGGAALLVAGANDARLTALWWAIDGPSWVAPQLVAVASRVDPSFAPRAKERIDREAAAGAPSKLLSALVHFVELTPAALAWFAAPGPRELVPQLVADDEHRGGELAARWDDAIVALLQPGA